MKICIFDLDGTLTNTLTAIAYFGNLALETYGFKTFPEDEYRRFVGDGRTKLIERMLDAQGALNSENYDKVCAVYDENYERDPLFKTDAYDGIRELTAAMKAAGIRMGVCSNKPDNVAQDVVRQIFGDNVFDFVAGVGEDGVTKPDPRMALKIAAKLGAEPSEAVFAGDTNVDIMTAKNAGMTSIGVLWGFRDRAELQEAGADYIISDPHEILTIINDINSRG